jgi:hypothetical protein
MLMMCTMQPQNIPAQFSMQPLQCLPLPTWCASAEACMNGGSMVFPGSAAAVAAVAATAAAASA